MRYAFLVSLSILIFSCNSNQPNSNSVAGNRDSLRLQLINVDKSWSEHSLQKGYHKSRIDFADNAATDLLEGEMPLHGINEIKEYAASHPDSTFTLIWKPLRCEVAASGELGYTFGGWTMKTKSKTGKDTLLFGDYMTVWKRQPNGSWKYIVDGGNNTPNQVDQ